MSNSSFSQISTTLQGIVGRVLRIPPRDLDIEAPFLELGADSLALVEALRGIQETFGVKLTIRQLFEQLPTIAALAGYLEQVSPHPPAPSPAPPAPLPGREGDLQRAVEKVVETASVGDAPRGVSTMAPTPVVPVHPVAPPPAAFTPLPVGREGMGEGPGVRASSGLERVLGMQIQAFNQLVSQQLQMLGRDLTPRPPLPSPPLHPGEGETRQKQNQHRALPSSRCLLPPSPGPFSPPTSAKPPPKARTSLIPSARTWTPSSSATAARPRNPRS